MHFSIIHLTSFSWTLGASSPMSYWSGGIQMFNENYIILPTALSSSSPSSTVSSLWSSLSYTWHLVDADWLVGDWSSGCCSQGIRLQDVRIVPWRHREEVVTGIAPSVEFTVVCVAYETNNIYVLMVHCTVYENATKTWIHHQWYTMSQWHHLSRHEPMSV